MGLIPASAEEIKHLVTSSFAARYHDLAATLEHSRQAADLVESSHEQMPAGLAASAWTQYGNALRLTGRYEEAETALARAGELPHILTTAAQLLAVKASLYRNTGSLESAAECLTAAIRKHKAVVDPAGEARLHNLLGVIYEESGKLPQAFRSFRNAMTLFRPDTPPDLVVSTGHNLLGTLIAANRLEDAAAASILLEPNYRRLSSPRIKAKAEWMRARLCRAMNRIPAARLAYDRACEILNAEPFSPELADLTAERAGLL
jgi:tetratricopeptide (TPR) repeat protein